mmetsp:Transcript_6703/g.9568  ORF Transcript_6703/g.9568 Transcript_6703/m.9568 type:complete len:203 (+) Transcript_6703:818-1426(+)
MEWSCGRRTTWTCPWVTSPHKTPRAPPSTASFVGRTKLEKSKCWLSKSASLRNTRALLGITICWGVARRRRGRRRRSTGWRCGISDKTARHAPGSHVPATLGGCSTFSAQISTLGLPTFSECLPLQSLGFSKMPVLSSSPQVLGEDCDEKHRSCCLVCRDILCSLSSIFWLAVHIIPILPLQLCVCDFPCWLCGRRLPRTVQ